MLQARDRLGLSAEALEVGRAGVSARQDHLERDGPVEPGLPRLVDDPHAAASQLAQKFVTGRAGTRLIGNPGGGVTAVGDGIRGSGGWGGAGEIARPDRQRGSKGYRGLLRVGSLRGGSRRRPLAFFL